MLLFLGYKDMTTINISTGTKHFCVHYSNVNSVWLTAAALKFPIDATPTSSHRISGSHWLLMQMDKPTPTCLSQSNTPNPQYGRKFIPVRLRLKVE